MALYLHNTLTRSRERFEPAESGKVTMYVCGPTVYNFAHIGNARPPVVFDVLARLLRRSYDLTYARNVTDVDDKINAAAAKEGVAIGVLTARYLAAYQEDMATLGVLPPDVEPKVTDNLGPIIAMIEKLVASGHAYEADGHVLFAVGSFADYGRLSGRDRDELIAGARVEVAPYKRDPADFVLWKPSPEDIVGWDSPWGRGRPGWHIECSAMAETHLGDTIDIHGGGQDLVFPHHENEVAQSTCAHAGRAYARYWIHNGLIHVDSEKMSKSIGNVLLVRDLLAEAPGEVVRLGLLTAHYRQPLDWTGDVLTEAEQKLDRMYGALREAGIEGPAADDGIEPPASVVEALEDDLNSPRALAELFSLARDANRADDPEERLAKARQLRAGAGLLGLLRDDPEAWFMRSSASADGPGGGLSDAEIDALMAEREALRQGRKFAEADAIRDKLASQNIVIEDSAGGPRWRRSR
ncbi:MAG: cysteine--tRNA ligase [Gammaproteobacteria bacterium]|nr:cysteine--tRNA ligase [Gammaproteobacteria bacterium]MDH3505602.1 cysteine--tRNA ligase [Gammaproteobacteria bacterium]